ncbi:MAG: hypothetical protein M1453_03360 [Acidobacteria bacterium]|nr:hypothetical protein [Acidobacteriota bacterium]MCL5287018.1 hypothetical protein [Acidobacteriota bacterium]
MNVMYNRKKTPADPFPSSSSAPLAALEKESAAGEPRTTADDWSEENNRQAAAVAAGAAASVEVGLFTEFRRKLAMGEALSRAVAKLAEALHFSGRITISFHQGRITKTVFEELHIRNTKATGAFS